MLNAAADDVSEEDPSSPDTPTPPAEPEQPLSLSRIAALAIDARPAEVSDSARHKLFQEWERAGITIQKAEQMRVDATRYQIQCVEAIVKKLGAGAFRYKEKLYLVAVSSKGVVYLREQKARGKHG